MAVLACLPELKMGLGLAFGAHFLHDFHKNVSYLIPYQYTKYTSVYKVYQTKCIIKFLFSQLMRS